MSRQATSSLQDELFGDVQAAPERVELKTTPQATWPRNVPSSQEAEALLSSVLEAGGYAALLRSFSQRLTAGQAAALSPAAPAELISLRHGLVMQLRLAFCAALKPGDALAPRDHQALETLLAEVDQVLPSVVAPAGAEASTQAAYLATREAVIREALALSAAAADQQTPEAAAATAEVPAKQDAKVTRLVNVESVGLEEQRAAGRRAAAVWGLLGAAILVGLGFHGYRLVSIRRAAQDVSSFARTMEKLGELKEIKELKVPASGQPAR